MEARRSPAVLPVAALVASAALGTQLRWAPLPALAALAAGGIAWGRWRGALVVALAGGLWLGAGSVAELPVDDPGLAVEAEGAVCSRWQRGRELPGNSARFCADWVRQGRRLLARPPALRLELASGIAPPRPGTKLRLRGRLSRFAGFANPFAAPRPGIWRLRVKAGALLREVAAPGGVARAAGAWRDAIDAAVQRAAPAAGPGVAMTRAFLLGDESGLTAELRRAMRRSGLAHLLAVSGFNVGIVAAVAWLAAAALPLSYRWLPALAALALYLAAVGTEPSVVRATLMGALGLTLLAARRPPRAEQALALAAGAMTIADPQLLGQAGFQLSFAATAGLVAGAARWSAAFAPLPRLLAAGLGGTLAAQAAALPFSVAAFGDLSPIAPLLNLALVPWASLWIALGLLWTLLALACPAVAAACAPALDLGAAPFAWLGRLPPSPWVSAWVQGGWRGGIVAAAALALAVECLRARRREGWALLLVGCQGVAPGSGAPATEVAFLDVGQGDATLVVAAGRALLIDGGGLAGRDLATAVLRPALAWRGLTRVEVAILSHGDRDHCQGLLDLTDYVPLDELWLARAAPANRCVRELAARAGSVRWLRGGQRLAAPGGAVEVLHPPAEVLARDANGASLVLRAEIAGRRFLFTGDLSTREEAELLAAGSELAAEVLKVAHHGSSSASSAAFLAAVRPRLAVISAGVGNAFGHPAPRVLARLRSAEASVLRTDRDGAIVLRRAPGAPWRLTLPASPRRVRSGG